MSNKNAIIFLITVICLSCLFFGFLLFLDNGEREKPKRNIDLGSLNDKTNNKTDEEESGAGERINNEKNNDSQEEPTIKNDTEVIPKDNQNPNITATSSKSILSPEKQKQLEELKNSLKN